jgi:protease PrsW
VELLAQTGTDGLYAIALALVVAVIYLIVIRFMDLNEKEPLWAVILVMGFGALSALVLPLFFESATLESGGFLGPFAKELAKFVALALAVAALGAIARQRGWAEIGGLMDGIVYGTAVGLGFAIGATLSREFTFGGSAVIGAAGAAATVGGTALAGLAEGLFGAIQGAGFGAAVRARSSAARAVGPLVGLIVAALAHWGYQLLARGGAVGGSTGRTWLFLALPILFVLAVIAVALRGERRAIRDELPPETETGAVTREELDTLGGFGPRRAAYARAFFGADWDYWLALRTLHNRQVQLALAKHHLSRERDPARREELEVEIERLRASSMALREAAAARKGRRGGEVRT